MQVKIKLLRHAKLPEFKTIGAAGCDLAYVSPAKLRVGTSALAFAPGETDKVALGVALQIPPGYEGQLRPRSSISLKGLLVHVGTIDSDYVGELHAIVTNTTGERFIIADGDRIAQLVIAPVARASFEAVDELSETARGTGGFGSTGR